MERTGKDKEPSYVHNFQNQTEENSVVQVLDYGYIYSIQNVDIFIGIQFFWCHSFTMFKQSKSYVSWLNRKMEHQDGGSPIFKIIKTGQVISV